MADPFVQDQLNAPSPAGAADAEAGAEKILRMLSIDPSMLPYNEAGVAKATLDIFAQAAAFIREQTRAHLALIASQHDWWCVGCQQRWSCPPDEGCSRASCPTCHKWMLNHWEYRAEAAEAERDAWALKYDEEDKRVDGLMKALEAERDALRLALTNVLKRDAEWAPSGMPRDCNCNNLSPKSSREYEGTGCPHQLAWSLLAAAPAQPAEGVL